MSKNLCNVPMSLQFIMIFEHIYIVCTIFLLMTSQTCDIILNQFTIYNYWREYSNKRFSKLLLFCLKNTNNYCSTIVSYIYDSTTQYTFFFWKFYLAFKIDSKLFLQLLILYMFYLFIPQKLKKNKWKKLKRKLKK